MATIVDALGITLGLDAKGVKTGMKQAEKTIGSGLKSIMGLLGPLAGGFAFKGLMDNFTKTADELGKTADRIGVSITDLDAWGQAAQHAGGSSEAFQASLESMNAGIQQLATQGTGRMKAPLEALGISAVDAAGKAKEPIAMMRELAAVAGKMDKAKFAGIAAKLGLDKGTIALLQQGDVEVEKLVKSMEKYSYTQEDATVAANYNDAMQDLGRAFQKIASIVMRVAVPAITWIADKITWLAGIVSGNKVAMVATFAAIAAVILTKILPALKAFGVAWMTNPATLVITAIVAGITLLLAALDDIRVWMNGGDSLLGDFFGPWPEFIDKAKQWFVDLWEGIKAKAEALWEWLKSAPGAFVDALGEWFGKALDWAAGFGSDLLDDIVGAFQRIIDRGKQLFQELWDWIVNLFKNIGGAIWDGIKGIGSKIGGALGGAWDKVTGLFKGGDEAAKDVGAGMAATGGVGAEAAVDNSTTTVDNSSETHVNNTITVNAVPADQAGQVAGDAARGASAPADMGRKASGSRK